MKKILFLGLLVLSLVGCSKHKVVPSINSTITSQQIENVMMDINVGTMNYIAADAIYSLPTRDFIETDFAVALKTFFVKMGEADYVNVEQNCNKFALGATFFMDYLHHNTTNKLSDTGIAFGEFYYTRSAANGGGGHAINITIIANKNGTNQFTVLFFEPQTYSLVQLTQEEIESCEFYRF